jgi:26S proteasome regulatory subunit N12
VIVGFLCRDKLPVSDRMYMLLGLNLLGLLASNEIARFHGELERIEMDQMQTNPFICYPMQLEQWMMEGSYNKLWKATDHPPTPEYSYFSVRLMQTIR